MFISNLLAGSVLNALEKKFRIAMEALRFTATYRPPQNKSYMGSRADSSAVCNCGDRDYT